MTEYEFILFDRVEKIKSVIDNYGENNFYISFSGGKDSTVLHSLIDIALPDNNIPRVYCNTGIELNIIKDFVMNKAKQDSRFEIIQPSTPIKQMLEKEGYPFKSKEHSMYVDIFQRNGWTKTAERYIHPEENRKTFGCPKILQYQFKNNNCLRISDKCCKRLKEEPLAKWAKENNKSFAIIGIMRSEGGRRNKAQCLAFRNKRLKAFQPLAPMNKEWEDWFIKEYNIELCDIYKEPYNFPRTGCKGCPFAQNLQKELDTLEKYFPSERKQCEYIWEPVYKEYRRIGYRLKK